MILVCTIRFQMILSLINKQIKPSDSFLAIFTRAHRARTSENENYSFPILSLVHYIYRQHI